MMFGLFRIKQPAALVEAYATIDRLTAENRTLQARLDALTPARGQGGKWVKKGGITYPDECDTTLPTPPETKP